MFAEPGTFPQGTVSSSACHCGNRPGALKFPCAWSSRRWGRPSCHLCPTERTPQSILGSGCTWCSLVMTPMDTGVGPCGAVRWSRCPSSQCLPEAGVVSVVISQFFLPQCIESAILERGEANETSVRVSSQWGPTFVFGRHSWCRSWQACILLLPKASCIIIPVMIELRLSCVGGHHKHHLSITLQNWEMRQLLRIRGRNGTSAKLKNYFMCFSYCLVKTSVFGWLPVLTNVSSNGM